MSTVAAKPPTVLVVMGVSGVGKSTIGAAVAERLGWAFQEGDALHAAASVAKMAAGIALDDEDRWPWLDRIRAWIRVQQASGRPGVITCSALTSAYRERIAGPGVVCVQLQADPALIADRLRQRRGHFMSAALLGSQLAALEALTVGEAGVVVPADGAVDQVVDAVLARVSELGEAAQG